jgi:hypothetical protein
MADTTDLATLLEQVNGLWNAGKSPLKEACTDGGAGTMTIASAAYSSSDTNKYDGVHIYVLDTSDDAAPEGESTRITAAGYTVATGVFALSPSPSANLESTDVVLFSYGLHMDDIFDALNDVQRSLKLPRYVAFPGLIPDGHMENSGTTDWTDVGSVTTTKSTTAGEILTGLQALKVASAISGEGVRSTIMQVNEQMQLMLSTVLALGNGDAAPSGTVQLYDETNGATIGTARAVSYDSSVSIGEWMQVYFQESVPANCHEVSVRFLSTTATNTTFYIDSCSVYTDIHYNYEIPLVVNPHEVEDVVYHSLGRTRQETDSYIALTEPFVGYPTLDILRDIRASISNRVTIKRLTWGLQLYLKFRQVGTTFTAIADAASAEAYHDQTTEADSELMKHGALTFLANRFNRHDASANNWRRNYLGLLSTEDLKKPQKGWKTQRRVSV